MNWQRLADGYEWRTDVPHRMILSLWKSFCSNACSIDYHAIAEKKPFLAASHSLIFGTHIAPRRS
jgi:hypothetical protein